MSVAHGLILLELGKGALLFGGFVVLLFFGSLVLPGPVHAGALLPDGTRKEYKLNGLLLFVVLTVIVAGASWFHILSLSIVYHHFWSLLVAANIFACALAAVLYLQGRPARTESSRPDGSRRAGELRNFYYGTQLNPSWMGVDLKLFSYRPSLMGLGLVNASFGYVQWETHGRISTAMLLYQVFYFLYLANYFQFEHGMLYTWDIVAERFGWMLIWGDYVLVPFFYSLPGWYLIDRLQPMPSLYVAGLVVLYGFGFWLFRGANEQKHRYKMDSRTRIWGRPAETLGDKLLISGFWGIGRKLNYTGELCMYYAWTLPCGLGSVAPYLLPLWLTCFFLHRAWRDEKRCRQKYGALWTAYCERAKFRMLPFIY